MHTPIERLQTTTTFASTVAVLMCAVYALSSYGIHHIYPPHPTSSLDVQVVQLNQRTVNTAENRKHDAASFKLHVDADFRSVWHWNVKQIYISCVASYQTPAFEHNEVVVWDRIVQNVPESKFSIDIPSKYCLEDNGDNLRDKEVTFFLEWHVLPYVGVPFISRATRAAEQTTVRMPAEYDFSLPDFFKTFMP